MCSKGFLVYVLTFCTISCTDVVVKLTENADADDVAEQHGYLNLGPVHLDLMERMYHFRQREEDKGTHNIEKRDVADFLSSHEAVEYFEKDEVIDIQKRKMKKQSTKVGLVERFNDPSWESEWFLNSLDSGVYQEYEYNINVIPAWEQGYNGSGVVLCVVDDGIEKSHPDLIENFDAAASFDMQDNKEDPSPRYASNEPNRHGTRCAGEIAGKKNNGICGVGVAHGSSIGGIRILDGSVTRIMESKALGFNTNYIDIYSASWGPPDNGKAMDGPKGITSIILDQAIEKGRDGKGVIYVWAGGNGGKTDDCNADGYQTMRYSVSIQAVGLNGDTPYYAEPCASALASTFSSGYAHSIATTDLHGKCTETHSGTSAAAPIAAAIIALALQANPSLTWRDVQHIIIRAATPDKLYFHEGWFRNAVGRSTHINFGYGLLDASRMVEIAKNWTNVGPDLHCQSEKQTYDINIPAHEEIHQQIVFDGCNDTDHSVNALEHVYLVLTVTAQNRGDISVDLTSPSGTRVQLLSTRIYDNDSVGLQNWKLNTVFMFGENPVGTWNIDIKNNGKYKAALEDMYLEVYGTSEAPKEENINLPQSNDESVCYKFCGLVKRLVYNSKDRCNKCRENVLVDIQSRSNRNLLMK